jgi:hypothetical protein
VGVVLDNSEEAKILSELKAGTPLAPEVTKASKPEATAAVEGQWPLPILLAFRYSFCYFILYTSELILANVPGGDYIGMWLTKFWHAVVPWVGVNVIHLDRPITIFSGGSGDTTQ